MNALWSSLEDGEASSALTLFLRRRLQEAGEDASSADDGAAFDPKVFWSVNALIFCIVVVSCSWYCCFGGQVYLTELSRANSDEAYRQTVLERRQRRLEARRDSPEKRRRRLLQSFQRTSVSMVRETRGGVIVDVYPNRLHVGL
jgi:hypothetical protein